MNLHWKGTAVIELAHINERIRQLCEKRGILNATMLSKRGLPQSTAYDIWSDRSNPSLATIYELAGILDMDVCEIFNADEDELHLSDREKEEIRMLRKVTDSRARDTLFRYFGLYYESIESQQTQSGDKNSQVKVK